MTTPTATRAHLTAKRTAWRSAMLLPVLCGVQFIDAFDVASMGPALPKIQHALGMTPQNLQWVVTAYVLGYGGFLLRAAGSPTCSTASGCCWSRWRCSSWPASSADSPPATPS